MTPRACTAVLTAAACWLVLPATARADWELVTSASPRTTSGEVALEVVFTPPPGHKLDSSFGPPIRLEISSSPPELLASGAGEGTELTRDLVVAPGIATGVLQVVAQVATCDEATEHSACHISRQDWGVPVRIVDGAPRRLALVLRGLDKG